MTDNIKKWTGCIIPIHACCLGQTGCSQIIMLPSWFPYDPQPWLQDEMRKDDENKEHTVSLQHLVPLLVYFRWVTQQVRIQWLLVQPATTQCVGLAIFMLLLKNKNYSLFWKLGPRYHNEQVPYPNHLVTHSSDISKFFWAVTLLPCKPHT